MRSARSSHHLCDLEYAMTNVALTGPEPDRVRAHLDALARRLGREGWYARITTLPGGAPGVHVINPAHAAGGRHVLVEDHPQGLWFRFRAGAFIAPVDELDAAAIHIIRLMAAPSA
jgi:hypothetical protein